MLTAEPAASVVKKNYELRASRLSIVVLSLVAAGLYGWASSRGTPHFLYSATIRTMSTSWHAFFYGVVDSSGWITIDKVPGWLWVHALLVRVLGMHNWVLLLPEMLAAAGTVPLLYGAVRRWAGPRAALWAVLAFLCTPTAFAVAMVNIPDTLMVLCAVAAAYAMTRALENDGWGWLIGSAAMLGLGFQMKMEQALIALPAFCLAYLVCAARPPLVRLVRTTVYGVVTLAISSLWMIAVSLTPLADRPKIDGSGDGSNVWRMVLLYNGVDRASGGNNMGDFFGGPPGPARLFDNPIVQQIGWLLPMAILFLVAGLVTTVPALRGGDRRGLAGWMIWGGWLAAGWVTLSLFTSSMHPYYTAIISPALAALVGAGLDQGYTAWRAKRPIGWLLPVGVLLTAGWTYVVLARQPSGLDWLEVPVVVAAVVAVGVLLLVRTGGGRGAVMTAGVVAGAAALLAAPTAWMLSTPTVDPRSIQVIDPATGPQAFQAFREQMVHNVPMPAVNEALLSYVEARDDGTRYTLATGDTTAAGPYITAGVNALPLRGFKFSSPAMTVPQLSHLVSSGQLRFVLLINQPGFGKPAALQTKWAATHCAAVKPDVYDPAARGKRPMQWDPTLYDCG